MSACPGLRDPEPRPDFLPRRGGAARAAAASLAERTPGLVEPAAARTRTRRRRRSRAGAAAVPSPALGGRWRRKFRSLTKPGGGGRRLRGSGIWDAAAFRVCRSAAPDPWWSPEPPGRCREARRPTASSCSFPGRCCLGFPARRETVPASDF